MIQSGLDCRFGERDGKPLVEFTFEGDDDRVARQQVAQAANAALTTLYWQVGKRVQTEILASQRAESGAQIVAALGRQLESRYGRGFGEKRGRTPGPLRPM